MMPLKTRVKLPSRGFSYQEMVIVLIVFSLALLAVFSFIVNMSRANHHGKEVYTSIMNTQYAITRIGLELQEAKKFVSILSPNAIAFEDSAGNNIAFSLTDTTLSRNGFMLAEQVTHFKIDYLDFLLRPTSLPSQVAYIYIELSITVNNSNHSKDLLIALRNR